MASDGTMPGRDVALELLHEYTTKPGLLQHAIGVEAAMRAHAGRLNQDPEPFGLVGLLHDFDYERWPSLEDHPFRGSEVLAERGWPDWFRRAILAHAPHTGVRPETDLERCLFAVDELVGFVTACVLVRPDRALCSLEVRSVRKRMKDRAFARAVSREDIEAGALGIGMPLDDHIAFVIAALLPVAAQLGLAGEAER